MTNITFDYAIDGARIADILSHEVQIGFRWQARLKYIDIGFC